MATDRASGAWQRSELPPAEQLSERGLWQIHPGELLERGIDWESELLVPIGTEFVAKCLIGKEVHRIGG